MKPFLLSKGSISQTFVYILTGPAGESYDLITMSYDKIKNPADMASMHLSYANVIIKTSNNIYKTSYGRRLGNVVNLYIHSGYLDEDKVISKLDDKPYYSPCQLYDVPPTILDFPKRSITFMSRGLIKSTRSNCLGIEQAKEHKELDSFFYNILYFLGDAIKTIITYDES